MARLQRLLAFVVYILVLISSADAVKRRPSKCPDRGKSALYHRDDGVSLPKTYEALLTCPNVTELTVRMTMNGCVRTFEPWAFDVRPGDRIPPLKKLTTSRYRFDHRWEFYRDLGLGGIPFPDSVERVLRQQTARFDGERNLERWLRAMDWTKLEHLGIDQNTYFFDRMHDELPSLRSLAATVDSFDPTFRYFLDALPPLESLSIVNSNSTPSANNTHGCSYLPTLTRHGPTLKHLTLHQPESSSPGMRRTVCTPAEIEHLYAVTPSLAHLSLDLDRDGAWPNATLDALVKHESLTSLHLFLEIGENLHQGPCAPYTYNRDGVDCSQQYREPRVSEAVVQALFEDLRAKKAGRELRRLEVDLGDWVNEHYMGPLYMSDWSEDMDQKFVCEVGVDSGVTCSEILHDFRHSDLFD